MKKIIFLSFLLSCYNLFADWEILYNEDFETSTDFPEWQTDVTDTQYHNPIKVDTAPETKDVFLGQFGDQKVTFILNNLPEHDSVVIQYDLYIILSWDGNWLTEGPDLYSFFFEDSCYLHATFTHQHFWGTGDQLTQSFPDNYGEGKYPPNTGSIIHNNLGYKFQYPDTLVNMNGVYRFQYLFDHIKDSLKLEFQGSLPSLNYEEGGIKMNPGHRQHKNINQGS